MPAAFALGTFRGNFIFYYRNNGQPAGRPLLHFHAKGRIRKLHLALLFIYFVLISFSAQRSSKKRLTFHPGDTL